MRDKWDEARGEQTYGDRTLANACDLTTETFRPRRRRRAADGSVNSNGSSGESNGHAGANGHAGRAITNADAGRCLTRRPEIIVGTDEWRVNCEVINALSDPAAAPEIYQRGTMLVSVVRARKAGKTAKAGAGAESVTRPDGTPRISTMVAPQVREIMTRVADFQKWAKVKGGDEVLVPTHPPDWSVSAVVARRNWPEVRPLEGVIEAPTLRPDGTILDTPGWDEETGLLYQPNAEFPPIPHTPSRMDAIQAAERILDLVNEFPFPVGDLRDAHRAAWLAGCLTALVRFAVLGPCPLFLFDANSPATGKSKLADVISVISTGRDMSRTTFPDSDEELRKRITSIALAGDSLMLFDNVAQGCPFGGASLDAALTATVWQDRVLGKSELTPELPLHTVWFATGNNVVLRGDVRRRVIPCRLETKEEKPEEREGFKYPDLLGHVRANRPQLVCDGLTILRAYVAAGRPRQNVTAFGSYEAWSALVRSAVVWTTASDPHDTRRGLREADFGLANLTALVHGWGELPGGTATGLTVAEAMRYSNDKENVGRFDTLRGALMEWSRGDGLPNAGTVGNRLRAARGRVVEGNLTLAALPAHGGVNVWRVEKV